MSSAEMDLVELVRRQEAELAILRTGTEVLGARLSALSDEHEQLRREYQRRVDTHDDLAAAYITLESDHLEMSEMLEIAQDEIKANDEDYEEMREFLVDALRTILASARALDEHEMPEPASAACRRHLNAVTSLLDNFPSVTEAQLA